MTDVQDTIGVIRHHRWLSAAEQERILKQRVRIVLSLGGGKAKQVTREELERLTRPGTRIEFVHVFLLADPKKRRVVGGMKADLKAALSRLVDKRGGVVVDVESGLSTDREGFRKAMMALAEDQIGRSNKGLKSALNGARSKGRPVPNFTADQMRDAKAVWRNTKDYPTWADAAKALPQEPEFTPQRAYKLWGSRH